MSDDAKMMGVVFVTCTVIGLVAYLGTCNLPKKAETTLTCTNAVTGKELVYDNIKHYSFSEWTKTYRVVDSNGNVTTITDMPCVLTETKIETVPKGK